jgi:hypothetical protein
MSLDCEPYRTGTWAVFDNGFFVIRHVLSLFHRAALCTWPCVANVRALLWITMALSRKRSRLAGDSDDAELPALSTLNDALKRSRTQCELDELDMIRADVAWGVDVDAILASTRITTPPGQTLKAHDNWERYSKGRSIVVLCVQGNVHIHYDLLW